jgi:integrase
MLKKKTVSMIKRGNVWHARWYENGKQRWKTLGTPDKGEARRQVVALESQLSNPDTEAPVRKDATPEEAWQIYLENRGMFLGRLTIVYYAKIWTAFWSWMRDHEKAMGKVDVVWNLSKDQVLAWRNFRAKDLQRNSLNTHITTLAVIFKVLQAQGVVEHNRFQSMPRFGAAQLRVERGRPEFLEEAEVTRLIDAAQAHSRDMLLFCALGVFLGLRNGEILAARWKWFHWPSAEDEGTTGYCLVPYRDGDWTSKSRKDRTIPLNARLVELLRPWRGLGEELVVAPTVTHWGVDNRRVPIGAGEFKKVLAAAGITKTIRPKELRHTFASTAVIAGIDPYRVMAWMGHNDLTTLKIYAHLRGDDSNIERMYTGTEVARLKVIGD